MRVELQRRVDQRLGPPICWLLSQFARWGRRPGSAHQPRQILVILLSEMGSLVLARPMFERLREQTEGKK